MFRIAVKRELNDAVTLMEIEAPLIAKKAKAGQFIILRVDEHGERIPLTIADCNQETGTVSIIFQKMGLTTHLLGARQQGEYIMDFVGPLGMATELEGLHKVAIVGGGVGCAVAYPIAKALHQAGVHVDIIAGFRTKDIIVLEEEMRNVCTNLYLNTDDGTAGQKGFVTDCLKGLLEKGEKYDVVFAIGPIVMMKFVAEVTRPWGIKTIASLTPIMIDGTGMCGGCRVTVGGETKFACVDGPDFDAHQVDFEELVSRSSTYREAEKHKAADLGCRMRKMADDLQAATEKMQREGKLS